MIAFELVDVELLEMILLAQAIYILGGIWLCLFPKAELRVPSAWVKRKREFHKVHNIHGFLK